MPLTKDDRVTFSLKIVKADTDAADIDRARIQLEKEIAAVQKLDTAHKNLFDPVNVLINRYQNEFNLLDGNLRTTITEQIILDAANKKLQNAFFPNDRTVSVPSLSSVGNIWTQTKPFALGYSIGKNYSEGYGAIANESSYITTILGYITSANTHTDIINTTGQSCAPTGSCDLPMYTTQPSCVGNGGVWTSGPDLISNDPVIQTLKTDIVNAVNTYKNILLSEVSLIVNDDKDSARQAQNNAAINNINNVIIPALNIWLAYPDFNTSHGQTTCLGFNSYNSNLLAPTKLHSTQLVALQNALNTRNSFISTRISQLNVNLGTISQNLSTGELISSSGLYGQRYNYLVLRLNFLGGSLIKLTGMQNSRTAQIKIKNDILNTKNIYLGLVPTSAFSAPANGTAIINVVDSSIFSVGNSVFIMAEGQEELVRAIKSISGKLITLNDSVPMKYRTDAQARIYKDVT
jgi:hypothetical protein